MHVNIRSLYNKMNEVKNFIQNEKPHILGISETELKRSHHSENWLRAGFKNMKKVYVSHLYKKHTNTLGNTMADQRSTLGKMLTQWEDVLVHGNPDIPNEVHIAGDMNLDSLKGRWLEADYPLCSLSRMVMDCCNSCNFVQVVDKVTRVQYNSVQNKTSHHV